MVSQTSKTTWIKPNLQLCSNHANPPHSFLHTMVLTASAQMRVDVHRWKTWGDTREMADEWGGIQINRQMKTYLRNADRGHGEGVIHGAAQHTKPQEPAHGQMVSKQLKTADTPTSYRISLQHSHTQQWETARSVSMEWRGQTCISTCLWCSESMPLRDDSIKTKKISGMTWIRILNVCT